MNAEELDYIEKVKLPEYEGYGWVNAANDLRKLIAEIRRLNQPQAVPSERSDKEPA